MDHLQVMSARFDQDDFWDPNLFSVPLTGSIEYPGNFATAPVDTPFTFDTALPQRNSNTHGTGSDQPAQWTSLNTWPSTEPIPSLEKEPLPRSKIPLAPEPRLPTHRRARKPPSGEALERRRQQNRAAQLAFRERSKTQVKELRQELAQCVDFNQKMQDTVRSLLERTDDLKRDIEALLAVKMPVTSLEAPRGDRNGAESGTGTPESETSLITEDEGATV